MAYPVTAVGVKQFLDYLIDKGLINPNTGAGMRSACEKLFSVLDEDEKQNLGGLDVDRTLKRFINLKPGVLSPESSGVYRARVKKALDLLEMFNRDPSGFKMDAIPRPRVADGARNGKPAVRIKNRQSEAPKQDSPAETPHDADLQRRSGSVSLTFPLREDFIAQFVLPKDLNVREAKRLAAYFVVLAIDYEPS